MDVIDIVRYLGALAFVFALVVVAGLAARRYGLPGISAGTAQRRLAVVESLMIGPRHRVFLLRRDDREHVVLLGPQGATLIESGIAAAAPAVPVALPATPPKPLASAVASFESFLSRIPFVADALHD